MSRSRGQKSAAPAASPPASRAAAPDVEVAAVSEQPVDRRPAALVPEPDAEPAATPAAAPAAENSAVPPAERPRPRAKARPGAKPASLLAPPAALPMPAAVPASAPPGPPAAEAKPDIKFPDPVEWSRALARIAEQSQRLVTDFL